MSRATSIFSQRTAIAALLTSLLLTPVVTTAATPGVFKSKAKDGSVLFSDAPVVNGAIQRSSYSNNYGKPMATASCNGVSLEIMGMRAGYITGEIKAAAAAHQVDPMLLKAIARVESCFDPHAVSVAGAQGLMQLMPATAKELKVMQPFDELQNLMGGAKYIAQMLKQFDGDLELALAAYNAGPGTVKRYNGIPPYKETQRYVKQVQQHYELFAAAGS